MNKQKIASILLYIVAFAIFAFGVLYIYTGFTSGLLPYHIKFLGKTCDELPPNVCELFKTLIQILGFALAAIGITVCLLTRGLFNGQQDKLDWKIIAVIVIALIPIIPITYHLATYTPWYIVAGILVLAIIALLIARPHKTPKP